jgi:hypothetical protein
MEIENFNNNFILLLRQMHILLGFTPNLFVSPFGAVNDTTVIPATYFWNHTKKAHINKNEVLLEEKGRFPIKVTTDKARDFMERQYDCVSIDGIPMENAGIFAGKMNRFDKTIVGNDLVSFKIKLSNDARKRPNSLFFCIFSLFSKFSRLKIISFLD